MEPEACTTMTDVRDGIDALDRRIVDLLAAARIKPERGAVRDEPRKAEVIANARRAAAELGVPADLAEALWEVLVEGSIAYELEAFDRR
jgi:isochorismate pyruvate lyase